MGVGADGSGRGFRTPCRRRQRARAACDGKAHKRRVVRPRWRRSCDCASSAREVTAPPVARLFENTPYGISVWVFVLFERFVCCRPLHRVAAWLADMGLAISPGTEPKSMAPWPDSGAMPSAAATRHGRRFRHSKMRGIARRRGRGEAALRLTEAAIGAAGPENDGDGSPTRALAKVRN